jgi:hypothetical protein
MKALTLWQPWATLVIIGAKTLETRSWATSYRGPLAIHAALAFPRERRELTRASVYMMTCLRETTGLKFDDEVLDALPLGCVLGTVDLTDCISTNKAFYLTDQERAFGDYSPDRFAWTLENPERFPVPIPARGYQGFWEWNNT